MAAPTLRRATPDDIPAVHLLVESAYRGDSARRGWTHEADLLDGQRTDADAVAAIVADPRQRLLVAEEEGAIIGCVQVSDETNGTAYLGLLSIAPERQDQGLARRLIAAAEAEAIASFGAGRIEMTVIRQRPELIAYYERRGYARTGEERPFAYGDPRVGLPRRDGLAFVVLSKTLAPGNNEQRANMSA